MIPVAIPTYARVETLNKATLRTLADGGISKDRITVFVADQQQADLYKQGLDPGLYSTLALAGLGITTARNAITEYFSDGQRILEIDDDIWGVFRRNSEGALEKVEGVSAFVEDAFSRMAGLQARLWGVYPVCNAFFMKENVVTYDLRPIIGTMHGRVITKQMPRLTVKVKSDIERTLLYYQADGRVMRFSGVAVKHKPFGPGGMQAGADMRTLQASADAALSLCRRFEGLCSPGRSFKRGHAEVKLNTADIRYRR